VGSREAEKTWQSLRKHLGFLLYLNTIFLFHLSGALQCTLIYFTSSPYSDFAV
jgi:hypothetical protein